MRSPDVYKTLDLPEVCMSRASRPCCRAMKPHHLWSQLSIPEAPPFHRRPLSWLTSDFSARAPKVALSLIIWSPASRRDFAAFERPALAAARRKADLVSVLESETPFLSIQDIVAISESITKQRELVALHSDRELVALHSDYDSLEVAG